MTFSVPGHEWTEEDIRRLEASKLPPTLLGSFAYDNLALLRRSAANATAQRRAGAAQEAAERPGAARGACRCCRGAVFGH